MKIKSNVPVYGTGTATFDVSAQTFRTVIPSGSTSGQQTLPYGTNNSSVNVERPARVIVSQYDLTETFTEMTMTGPNEGDPNSRVVNNNHVSYKADLSVATNGGWQDNYQGVWDAAWGDPPPEKLHVEWSRQRGVSPTNETPPPIPFVDWTTWPGAAVVQYDGWEDFYYDHPPGTDGKFKRDLVKMGAHTSLKLYSGGKSHVGGQSLIRLNVVNAQYYKPIPEYAYYEFPWFYTTIIPITNWSRTRLKTQPVGAGGVAWKMMPENETADVTFKSFYQHYSADVVPEKFKANIILTTSTTNANLATDVPEICVGQKVTFALTNLPMSQVKNITGGWKLPPKFVNQQAKHSPFGSPAPTSYDINQNLLRNTNATSCWFVNGTGGSVSVGLNLLFTNGQAVSVAAVGRFTVHRPSATNFINLLNYFTWDNPTLQANESWRAELNSKYDGLFGVTQILNANGGIYDTGGNDYLDGNTEIYGDASGPSGPQP